jgi:hydrogenase-4 component F
MLIALILIPAAGAAIAYPQWSRRWRPGILMACALAHAGLTAVVWGGSAQPALGGWLAADALGLIVLTLVSLLFLGVAHYAVGWARHPAVRENRIFVSCLLAFLAAATLVTLSHHLALLWIGMESTTLAIAPLIFDRHDRRSLEAVWKYLVLSSVGIAFALLGVFLLASAQPSGAAGGRPLMIDDMIRAAALLDPAWLRLAFVFIAIGFGTKMGLAPLHSWKPDAYGVAPGLVAGLMAGALTSCAFLGLARVSAICFAAGLGSFIRPVLIAFGLLSLVIAAAFIVGQRDVKRLLAYSSVEHMGLLVLGLGLGGVGAYGAVLHSLNNGLAKGLTFLAVGNVVLAMGTSTASQIRGLGRRMPATATLLVVGLFAITGAPPFGLFLSEFSILSGAFGEGHPWVAVATIILLAIIFVGIAGMLLEMVYGTPQVAPHTGDPEGTAAEPRWLVVAPALFASLVLMLGLYIPPPLAEALSRAAVVLGGHAP